MARKLLMPVQYEPVLGGLNKARPLSLQDEGRVILSSPVLNAESVSNEKAARGKFLRCKQGMVINNPNKFTATPQYYFYSMSPDEISYLLRTFDPPVECILLRLSDWVNPGWFDWFTPDYLTILQRFSQNGSYIIPLIGTDFNFRCRVSGAGYFAWELFGFYGKDI